MKFKYNLYFTNVCGSYCAVGMGADARRFSGVLSLNEMGYDVAKHLTEDVSRDELIDRVLSEYEGSRDEAAEAVDKVIEKLRAENLLDE